MKSLFRPRVFVSGVSGEFAVYREELDKDLTARGFEVRFQDVFRQGNATDTILKHLFDYIQRCSTIVCLVGNAYGDAPPEAATRPFVHMVPDELANTRLSYTQWEFVFGRYLRKRILLYRKVPPKRRRTQGRPQLDKIEELQAPFVRYLHTTNLNHGEFDAEDSLCRLVLREDWPGGIVEKAIDRLAVNLGGLRGIPFSLWVMLSGLISLAALLDNGHPFYAVVCFLCSMVGGIVAEHFKPTR